MAKFRYLHVFKNAGNSGDGSVMVLYFGNLFDIDENYLLHLHCVY